MHVHSFFASHNFLQRYLNLLFLYVKFSIPNYCLLIDFPSLLGCGNSNLIRLIIILISLLYNLLLHHHGIQKVRSLKISNSFVLHVPSRFSELPLPLSLLKKSSATFMIFRMKNRGVKKEKKNNFFVNSAQKINVFYTVIYTTTIKIFTSS